MKQLTYQNIENEGTGLKRFGGRIGTTAGFACGLGVVLMTAMVNRQDWPPALAAATLTLAILPMRYGFFRYVRRAHRRTRRQPDLLPFCAAAMFWLLPAYEAFRPGLAWLLPAVSVLPAAGMALLLTCFGRSSLTPGRRYLPVVCGWITLGASYTLLPPLSTPVGALLAALAPSIAALTVMPAVYYLIYRIEVPRGSVALAGRSQLKYVYRSR